MTDPRDIGHDTETCPDVFTAVFVHIETGQRWIFEISERHNHAAQLYQFLTALRGGYRLVGFNNVGFDWPVLEYFMSYYEANGGQVTAYAIYLKAQSIIDSVDRFGHLIWQPRIAQLDLYKIHHFDNPAKATGLKVLEFNMRSHTIEDLPFPPGQPIGVENIPILIEYNCHDVAETIKFYHHSAGDIKLRDELTAKFGKDFTNHSKTKLGSDIFLTELEKAGVECYDRSSGRRQPRQTLRPSIALGPLIFDYVAVTDPDLQRMVNYLRATTIYTTKDTPELKDATVTLGGLSFAFGTGGMHASLSNAHVKADDETDLIDVDVASFYPNLGIRNRVYPAHLSPVFCDVNEMIFDTRKTFPKKSAESATYKEALNATYGNSNNDFSPFKDAAYTMTITINGQLLICMLAEATISVPGVSLVQVNTDGITIRCPKARRAEVMEKCKAWETLTKLDLEYTDYTDMWIRDVNNYVARSTTGFIKRIGAYAFETAAENPATRELGWHKDWSSRVVPMAAVAALTDGIDPKDFIARHTDAFDFMIRAKAPRTSRIELTTGAVLANTIRYQVARGDGPYLFKVMPPLAKNGPDAPERRIAINKGWPVRVCNTVTDWSWDALDRTYYEQEARKLIGMITNGKA